MKRVYIASPFRGATVEETRQNIIYARMCMLDSLQRGEAPYASHLLYTQVWTEQNREPGLAAGDAWREAAQLVAIYADLGTTAGMSRALTRAAHSNQPTATRLVCLPGDTRPRSVAEWREILSHMFLSNFPELDAR